MSWWKIKQLFRKWAPMVAMAFVAWVGFTHWQRGGRANVNSVMRSAHIAAVRLPVLGSYFKPSRHYSRYRGSRHYAYGHGRRHRKYHRGHRAHRRRRHRR